MKKILLLMKKHDLITRILFAIIIYPNIEFWLSENIIANILCVPVMSFIIYTIFIFVISSDRKYRSFSDIRWLGSDIFLIFSAISYIVFLFKK